MTENRWVFNLEVKKTFSTQIRAYLNQHHNGRFLFYLNYFTQSSEPVSALRKLPFMFWARLWRKNYRAFSFVFS